MPLFSTVFNPPPTVSGLEVTLDVDLSMVRLDWDTSSIADVDFANYRIYRAIGTGPLELVRQIGNKTTTSWEDFGAPLNINVTYHLTQSNLDFESDPVEASAEMLSPYWWIVTPGDSSLTFAMKHVQGADLSSEKVQEVYTPLGRPSRLVVGDVVLTESGSVSFLIYPDETDKRDLLRRIQARMEGGLLLKAPDGVVHEVQYGDMTRRFTPIPGLQEITIPFIGAD